MNFKGKRETVFKQKFSEEQKEFEEGSRQDVDKSEQNSQDNSEQSDFDEEKFVGYSKNRTKAHHKQQDHSYQSQDQYASYERGSSEQEKQKRQAGEYEFTKQDAKIMSQQGFLTGQRLLTVEDCRDELHRQLTNLNRDYKYSFSFQQRQELINQKRTMTRTIYLKFDCEQCGNRWTSIAGTFEVQFWYSHEGQHLEYYMKIYGEECIQCQLLAEPLIYQIQMDAMNIFFSVVLINIIKRVPRPEKHGKYYIRENHHHKSELCEACQLGRCITQPKQRNKQ